MIIYTKRQMLEEGFWSALKAGGRGILGASRAGLGVGAKALDIVAPEITKPIHDIEKNVVDTASKAWADFERIWKGKARFIADSLLKSSFKMDMSKKPKKVHRGEFLVYAHKIVGYDNKGNPERARSVHGKLLNAVPLIVDIRTGEITKNVNSAKVFNRKRK